MKMNLHYFYYICKSCGHKYKSPHLPGDRYGEFLMKTATGYMKYINALNDLTFKEFSKMVRDHSLVLCLRDLQIAKLIHHIFGIACDKAPDGNNYQITQMPICPYCKACEIQDWGPTRPPQFINVDVDIITHETWNNLSKEGKKELLDVAIREEVSKIKKVEKVSWITRFMRGTKKFFSPF